MNLCIYYGGLTGPIVESIKIVVLITYIINNQLEILEIYKKLRDIVIEIWFLKTSEN